MVTVGTLVARSVRYFSALAVFHQKWNGSRRILRLRLKARVIDGRDGVKTLTRTIFCQNAKKEGSFLRAFGCGDGI